VKTGNSIGSQSFPYRVKNWNGQATIYRIDRQKAGRIYHEFRVAAFDSEGIRRFESFSEFGEALRAAEARLLALGLLDPLTLSGPDRLDYLATKELLPPGSKLLKDLFIRRIPRGYLQSRWNTWSRSS
jgi:hypothetical protein